MLLLTYIGFVGALQGLNVPTYVDGSRFKHDFFHEDENGVTILKYDVTHHEDQNFLHLDQVEDALINCGNLFDDSPSLLVRIPLSAHNKIGNVSTLVISGGFQWGCRNGSSPISILHKIIKPPHTTAISATYAEVLFSVEPASLVDVFYHADIHFQTSKFPTPDILVHGASEESGRQLLSQVDTRADLQSKGWGFLGKIWASAKTLGSAIIAPIVTAATIGIKILTGGDLTLNQHFTSQSWKWNLDPAGAVIQPRYPINDFLSCSKCAAQANNNIIFSAIITAGKLQSMSLTAEGNFSGQVGLEQTFIAEAVLEYSKVVATINIPPITFVVAALPITLRVDIPITLGIELTVGASSSLVAAASCSGTFKYGLGYTQSAGMGLIHENDFKHTGSLTSLGKATMTVVLYVIPTVLLQVDYIGNVNMAPKIFLEAATEIGTTVYGDPCYKSLGTLSLNLGLQLTLGCKVDIQMLGLKIYEKTFQPATVLSKKYPILTGCIPIPAESAQNRSQLRVLMNDHAAYRKQIEVLPFPQQNESWGAVWDRLPSPPGGFWMDDGEGQMVSVTAINDIGCAPGTSWIGSIRQQKTTGTCSMFPKFRQLSMQAIESHVYGYPSMTVVISSNDQRPVDQFNRTYACVKQATYGVSVRVETMTASFVRQSAAGDNNSYSYCSGDIPSMDCTCADATTEIPARFLGGTDGGLGVFQVSDTEGCTAVTLKRVMVLTTGATIRKLHDAPTCFS